MYKKLILLNQTNGAKSKIAPNVGNKSRILLRRLNEIKRIV